MVEGCAFLWDFEPNIICCDTICRNVCLVSFHCSYLKQYISFMPGVKKSKECGLLWQYETTLLWTGKELTGNNIPYRSLSSSKQANHKQQQQPDSTYHLHELQSELERKWSGTDTREVQTFLVHTKTPKQGCKHRLSVCTENRLIAGYISHTSGGNYYYSPFPQLNNQRGAHNSAITKKHKRMRHLPSIYKFCYYNRHIPEISCTWLLLMKLQLWLVAKNGFIALCKKNKLTYLLHGAESFWRS